jgi:hypothetical protein
MPVPAFAGLKSLDTVFRKNLNDWQNAGVQAFQITESGFYRKCAHLRTNLITALHAEWRLFRVLVAIPTSACISGSRPQNQNESLPTVLAPIMDLVAQTPLPV